MAREVCTLYQKVVFTLKDGSVTKLESTGSKAENFEITWGESLIVAQQNSTGATSIGVMRDCWETRSSYFLVTYANQVPVAAISWGSLSRTNSLSFGTLFWRLKPFARIFMGMLKGSSRAARDIWFKYLTE